MKAKYYSIIVDATPDCSHVEQTTFILRYILLSAQDKFEVQERFFKFVDFNKKTGAEIATLILDTLKEHSININDCRGEGYDNGSNMSGKYAGVQAHVLKVNPLAVFSPCACHSLNLCGAHLVLRLKPTLAMCRNYIIFLAAAPCDGRYCKRK